MTHPQARGGEPALPRNGLWQRWPSFLLGHSLYANSLWILLALGGNYGFGMLFWLAAARLYAPADVGHAAAVLSAAPILAFLGTLGLNTSIVRFLPTVAPRGPSLINTALTATGGLSIILALLFLAGVELWAPGLAFLRQDVALSLLFVVLVAFSSLATHAGAAFQGLRRAAFATIGSAIHGTWRVAAAIILASSLGSTGLVLAWTTGLVVAVGCSLILFLPRVLSGYNIKPALSRSLLRNMATFSLVNFMADGLWSITGWVLPIIVLHLMGPEHTAVFIVAWGAGTLPAIVPNALASAMLAEGSHAPDTIGRDLHRSIVLGVLILCPVIALLVLFGDHLLMLFGPLYAEEGHGLLAATALAILPATVTILLVSIARVRGHLASIITMNGLVGGGTLLVSLLLLPSIGIIAVGLALMFGHLVAILFILPRLPGLLKHGPSPKGAEQLPLAVTHD